VVEVEDGAGLVVGELFEENRGLVVFVKDAGSAVAGEPRVKPRERGGYAGADARRFGRVDLFESFEAFAEASCILVRDREDADAALRTAWVAGEMMTATDGSIRQGIVDDLNEVRNRSDPRVESSGPGVIQEFVRRRRSRGTR
jgi:hypothetical protein